MAQVVPELEVTPEAVPGPPAEPGKRYQGQRGPDRVQRKTPVRSSPAKSPPSPGGSPSSSGAGASARRVATLAPATTMAGELKEIYDGVLEMQVGVGVALRPVLPVTGAVMIDRSESVALTTVKIASRNPAVLNALMAVVRYSPYAALAGHVGALSMAIAIDAGRMDPNSKAARKLLGDALLEEVIGELAERDAAADRIKAEIERPAWAQPTVVDSPPGAVA